jgi:hypothetical protein
MNDLKAFLDGELDGAAAGTMQARIQSDGSLAAAAADFRLLSSSFGALNAGPRVTGREKVMEAIRKPRVFVFPWKFATGLASVVLLVALVANLQKGGGFETAGVESEAAARTSDMAAGKAEAPARPGEPSPGAEGIVLGSPQAPLAGTPRKARDLTAPGSNADEAISSIDPEAFQRKVIRTGALTVRVDSVEAAESKVNEYVDGVRGYVEDTSSQNLNGKTPSMTMVLRIPQNKFGEAMAAFEKLGTRLSKDAQASDVTQQVVDLDARLKNLRTQEETYRAILRKANKIGEIVDVQSRISAIRGTLESSPPCWPCGWRQAPAACVRPTRRPSTRRRSRSRARAGPSTSWSRRRARWIPASSTTCTKRASSTRSSTDCWSSTST